MTCRICDGGNLKKYITVNKWELYKCLECNYIQVTNKPCDNELEEIYSNNYYDNNKYNDIKSLHKEYNYRTALMMKFLKVNDYILDYGCAQADFIFYANQKFKFIGVEYSKSTIYNTIQKHPELKNLLFHYTELDRLPDYTLQGIVMWDVIEHLWNPKEVIKKLLEKLCKGGYLFISTPKIDSFFARITKKYWPFMTPPEHLGFLTSKSILYFSNQMGLSRIYDYSKGKWVNLGFIIYKIKKILPHLIPAKLLKFLFTCKISRISIFVPTNDIRYMVFKKC